MLLSNVVIAFAEKDPHFDVVSSVRFFMYAAGIVALNGLRAGLSSAWKAIQVIWAILIAFSAGLEGLAIFSGFSMTAFQAAIFILLGLYLHTKKVKAFCSVGRPAACDSVSNRDDIAAAVPSPSPPTEPDQASQDKLAVAVEHEVSVVMNRKSDHLRPPFFGKALKWGGCLVAGVTWFALLWFWSQQPPRNQAAFAKQANQEPNGTGFTAVDEPRPPKKQVSAIDRLRRAAEQGDEKAQYNLGLIYYQGQGTPQDYTEAVKWWRRAAEQGDVIAQHGLALCYNKGQGVTQDYAEAVKWYRKAAEQGYSVAQDDLSLFYSEGKGVSQNSTEAVKWSRKAAEQGYANAQHNLGIIYYNGRGVSQDYAEAAKWLRKAAEQGYALAQAALGACYSRGDGVPRNDIEAYKWFSLAAAEANQAAAKYRDELAAQMARAEIAEGQRRAVAFVAKPERTEAGVDGNSRTPTWEDVIPSQEDTISVGTGFFVTDDGYLVTCEHVVRGATAFRIKVPGRSIAAKLIKSDRSMDVALLKVNTKCQALPVSPEPLDKLGAAVFTIGFPNPELQGEQPKLTRGEISSKAGIRDNPRYFQISVPVQPGNSGGALVDENGNVVGVVTARLDDLATYEASGSFPQNVNYAVKGNFVRTFLNSVPELAGKLKAPHTARDRDAASAAAERAAVLVVAE